jgi:dihydroxy-acid dehydratase
VLHVSPESASGGTLALVQDGDLIQLDVAGGQLNLLIEPDELEKRKASWKLIASDINRGYVSLYIRHVEQAHLGADFDFLKGGSGSIVARDSH